MSNKMMINAISAVIAMGLGGASIAVQAETQGATGATHVVPDVNGMEKCYGIARAGMNDCGSAVHNCAGEAKQDGQKDTWMFVPTGLCKKIVGGSTKAPTEG